MFSHIWGYRLASCLFGVLILAGCSSSDAPSNQSSKLIYGTYVLKEIWCAGEKSSAYTSALENKSLEIKVVYNGETAERISSFMGCVQHVPVTAIEYLDGTIMKMTEGESFCEEATKSNCAPSMCTSKTITQDFKYAFTSDSLLEVEIPPNDQQGAPCGPGQLTDESDKVIFKYEKTN